MRWRLQFCCFPGTCTEGWLLSVWTPVIGMELLLRLCQLDIPLGLNETKIEFFMNSSSMYFIFKEFHFILPYFSAKCLELMIFR